MTDLDDALASSAPVYYPPTLLTEWAELPPDEVDSGNADTMRNMSSQIGSYTVTHSLEDGLPDPVTMTTGNDANGRLDADLHGRQGITARTMGWRTGAASGNGTGTALTTSLPSDTTWGDYSIVAISVNSDSIVVQDANADDSITYGWRLLGSQSDGSNLKVWVFGREYYAAGGPLSVVLSSSEDYSWVAVSAYARSANGNLQVPLKPGTFVSAPETVSQTTHTAPSAELDRRGYLVGIWGRVGTILGWSAGAGSTELGEATGAVNVMVSTTALREPGPGVLTATTASNTTVATMIAVPLRIMDRTTMSPRRFFSPLNPDSPMYGWERDTAGVSLDFNTITASGIQSVPIFRGQMADIRLENSLGRMPAVSRTRIDLNASTTMPVISGRREGLSVDTLATWLMAQGRVYAGPGPSENTIFWAPFYDSVHAFMDGPLSYAFVYEYRPDNGPFGVTYPEQIPGPFVSSLHAYMDSQYAQQLQIQGARTKATRVPGRVGHFHDFMSQANNKGRLSFWVKGQSVVQHDWLAVNAPARNYIVSWRISHQNNTGNVGGMTIYIDPVSRRVRVDMGQQSGYTTITYAGTEIPEDDDWHFVGVSWDWLNGLVRVQVDGVATSGSGYATTDSILSPTDADFYSTADGYFFNQLIASVPISDAQLETGPECWSGVAFQDWARFYPVATDVNAVYRRTGQRLEAVAEPDPVNSWDMLAQLARNTLSSYRCDEQDQYNFLPLNYFGEAEQMEVSGITDTELNAGELNVSVDASKTRNVVTVAFPETREDTTRQTVLSLTSAFPVPRGTTRATFALDLPSTEIHGAASPYVGSAFTLTLLTSAQIAAPATIPAENYITPNMSADGSGTVVTTTSFSGQIVGFDSSSVTIEFTNRAPSTVYLANSGQDVPFMRILGYAVRKSDGYSTYSDPSSIARRRERPLVSEMNWVHHRDVAEDIAGKLLNITTRPRAEVLVQVVGDPRRKPGQLVTVNDSQETAASGTWRILKVQHNGDGAKYTQDLQLVRVNPVLVWGESPGWGEAVWGE